MVVDQNEPEPLLAAIGSFLQACRTGAEMEGARAFWSQRPQISAAEIGMVASLRDEPLAVEELATKLKRDVCSTRDFLTAMVSVGILERRGDLYHASPAALLYCRAVAEGLGRGAD